MVQYEIDKLLLQTGITCKYKAYQPLRILLKLMTDDPDRLEYPFIQTLCDTAAILECSTKSIQSSLNSLVERLWVKNPAGIAKLSGYPLTCAPSVAQLIELLAVHLLRELHIE